MIYNLVWKFFLNQGQTPESIKEKQIIFTVEILVEKICQKQSKNKYHKKVYIYKNMRLSSNDISTRK